MTFNTFHIYLNTFELINSLIKQEKLFVQLPFSKCINNFTYSQFNASFPTRSHYLISSALQIMYIYECKTRLGI